MTAVGGEGGTTSTRTAIGGEAGTTSTRTAIGGTGESLGTVVTVSTVLIQDPRWELLREARRRPALPSLEALTLAPPRPARLLSEEVRYFQSWPITSVSFQGNSTMTAVGGEGGTTSTRTAIGGEAGTTSTRTAIGGTGLLFIGKVQ